MENAQQINWWLEVGKIAIPTLVALIVPFVTYRWITRKMADYQTILSKDIEDYKKDISKELEIHKIQLQSNFQTRFYEFQTRYSVLHQKRAEVIQDLFTLLTKLSRNAKHLETTNELFSHEGAELFYSDLKINKEDLKLEIITEFLNNYKILEDFYIGKSIYFSQEICQRIDKLLEEGGELLIFYGFKSSAAEKLTENFKNSIGEESFNKFIGGFSEIDSNKLSSTIKLLENEFKQLIFAENPNNQLEIKR